MNNFSEQQLLSHLAGLGQWTRIRAQELHHFSERLPAALEKAGGNPAKTASLLYALNTYVDGVQDLLSRTREVQTELNRRLAETKQEA